MARYAIKRINECSVEEKNTLDNFILDGKTNGEFLNSIRYLSYHPVGRFLDDSIAVMDVESNSVRGVMMAASKCGEKDTIISHPGTTFAGPILRRNCSIAEKEAIINIMLDYYEAHYKRIIIKPLPSLFAEQPAGSIDFWLLRRGYQYEMIGLSNVINITKISNEDDIFSLYDSAKRNQTRKVIKKQLFCFDKSEKEINEDVWQRMADSLEAKHHAKITHTYEEIVKLYNRFPDKIVPYYVRTKDKDYGAFALVYKFKNVFHTQYLDTNYSYTGDYPNLLLIFELIRQARHEGYDWLSFGISTENGGQYLNYGLYNYKAGYGGGDIVISALTKIC
ncbi:MAG: GNAT family N-acetyltransferase [Lachnospiraceae bacterium]|nr:GNAT family N-acetyltransferase [Lachnospiraceae bacterium]